jgi:hypothetical protein
VGIAGGLLVGMASPELGVGVASGGLAVAASQFATQEVAAYQATQQQASTTPTPSSGVNGVNGWPQARAMGSGY